MVVDKRRPVFVCSLPPPHPILETEADFFSRANIKENLVISFLVIQYHLLS